MTCVAVTCSARRSVNRVAAFFTARRILIARRDHHRPQSGFSVVIVWISLKNRGECGINVGLVKIVVVGMLGNERCGLL
jgi:hypothetical protein